VTNIIIMADGEVGRECLQFLINDHCSDLGLVVTTSLNAISDLAKEAGIATCVYQSEAQIIGDCQALGIRPEIGLLLWWPHIISQPLLSVPKLGFINTHPSYLPHNRGKHYSFWAIVEQAPFGVTLHRVEKGVDTGEIIAQKHIPYDWCDTGETLAEKAREAMIALFRDTYPSLRSEPIVSTPQLLGEGSFHKAAEIEAATRIDLDAPTTARAVLNLLRAKMYSGLSACTFEDGGKTYEVQIKVRKIS
jgi:methionyl-tRNA formyltransferase